MPVPVPRLNKPVAHPVVKHLHCADTHSSPFQSLTRTLPLSPTGPPPSYGTREQWINSLPSWRRSKPRRIWEEDAHSTDYRGQQGFCNGLTAAVDASVIKGAHAEACIPPCHSLLGACQPPTQVSDAAFDDDADDEMTSEYSPLDRDHLDHQSQWSASSPLGPDGRHSLRDGSDIEDPASYDCHFIQGSFSPICEDKSPDASSGPERDSSPLQPITPFGDFVDRAVASIRPCEVTEIAPCDIAASRDYSSEAYVFQPTYPTISDEHREPAPTLEVVTPCATHGYKKLAEPLADWVVNYVWKVCTTGLSLPSTFGGPSNGSISSYPSVPPNYLAASVHSLLLSTLLQPSAVFLAIWYIIRLPVYFAAVPLEPEFVKEARFRAALLGDPCSGFDQEAMEASAPFRLIVLGCMLANKWLDDHTFSNKTWHSISNVPIQVLNKLEALALDIFTYDLSISSGDWSKWLVHVMSYHMSMVSPTHPQPISRPSSNPHSIVRRAIEEIIQAPAACDASSSPQPVFIGLEQRKKEKIEKEQAMAAEVLEIDLDEDGPLREEYLPKRRGSYRTLNPPIPPPPVVGNALGNMRIWDNRNIQEMERSLPPPARWSPSGDEPIYPERNRMSGQYVAVQPPVLHGVPAYPAPYYQHVDVNYPHWNMGATYAPVEPRGGYHFNLPPIDAGNLATYNSYPYGAQIPVSHSRSQSLSYQQESMPVRNHARTYSQAQFGYRCSELRMTANEFVPSQHEAVWVGSSRYPYHGPTFASIHPVHYPPAWVRI